MEQSFRARYEQRGRDFRLLGEEIAGLSRDELFAVIGYLLALSEDRGGAARIAESAALVPLGSPRGAEAAGEDPPKNDGLYEG